MTTFFLKHEIDTGHIIRRRRLPVAETDDAGRLHDALMDAGAQLVIETVDLLIEAGGTIETRPQETLCTDEEELRHAPKIFKDTCRINWKQPVAKVYDFVRGLSPYPAAWTELVLPDGRRSVLKLFATEKRMENHRLAAGTIRTDSKKHLDIAAEDGFIRVKEVQLAGKKRMAASDFLNGIALSDTRVE